MVYNEGMGKDQQIATWVFMVITALCRQLGLKRTDFVSLANKYKITDFLFEHYELLHYYDNDYIMDDVMRFIDEQGGNSDELLTTA